jgi:hypothetical protein
MALCHLAVARSLSMTPLPESVLTDLSGGGVPAGLPGSPPGAQSVGLPGGYSPAQSSPASAVVGGTGPLPGPATVGTR